MDRLFTEIDLDQLPGFQETLQSLELRVSVETFNSKEFGNVSATKIRAPMEQNAEILEVGENELILETPAQISAEGHHLYLSIETVNAKTNVHFTSTAKMLERQELEHGRERVKILLLQYDKKTWNLIRSLMAQRQEDVSRFLKQAKGH